MVRKYMAKERFARGVFNNKYGNMILDYINKNKNKLRVCNIEVTPIQKTRSLLNIFSKQDNLVTLSFYCNDLNIINKLEYEDLGDELL